MTDRQTDMERNHRQTVKLANIQLFLHLPDRRQRPDKFCLPPAGPPVPLPGFDSVGSPVPLPGSGLAEPTMALPGSGPCWLAMYKAGPEHVYLKLSY